MIEESLMEIAFTVLGNPKAQKRHRTYTRGKGGRPLPFARQVDPSKTDKADFLAQVMQFAPPEPLEGPLHLGVWFFFARPKSHYMTGRHADTLKAKAPMWHTAKKDADNLLKLVMDAMNAIFFKDDSQIVYLTVTKQWADAIPRTEVMLRTLV